MEFAYELDQDSWTRVNKRDYRLSSVVLPAHRETSSIFSVSETCIHFSVIKRRIRPPW
jgi:hypothetical protein